jgi:hypothetical protein
MATPTGSIQIVVALRVSIVNTMADEVAKYRNYTHNNKAFIKANLIFYSICVIVYVDGYIAVIRKMRIKTKHSST